MRKGEREIKQQCSISCAITMTFYWEKNILTVSSFNFSKSLSNFVMCFCHFKDFFDRYMNIYYSLKLLLFPPVFVIL